MFLQLILLIIRAKLSFKINNRDFTVTACNKPGSNNSFLFDLKDPLTLDASPFHSYFFLFNHFPNFMINWMNCIPFQLCLSIHCLVLDHGDHASSKVEDSFTLLVAMSIILAWSRAISFLTEIHQYLWMPRSYRIKPSLQTSHLPLHLLMLTPSLYSVLFTFYWLS